MMAWMPPNLDPSRTTALPPSTPSCWGPAPFSFWWKVSSETNQDFLKFIGPEGEVRLSGEVDWQFRSYHLPPGARDLQLGLFQGREYFHG